MVPLSTWETWCLRTDLCIEGLSPAAVTASVGIGANLVHVPMSAMMSAIVAKTPIVLRIMTSCRGRSRPPGPRLFNPPLRDRGGPHSHPDEREE